MNGGAFRSGPWKKFGPKRQAVAPTQADFCQAATIEHAACGVNQINARTKQRRKEERDIQKRREERAKITMPSAIDAWLKKELP